MEEHSDRIALVELMLRPAFCVKNYTMIHVNRAAESLLLTAGMDVRELLLTGKEEYAAFSGGCLYLTLQMSGTQMGASVVRVEDMDIFLLDDEEDAQLKILGLAAQQLRDALSNVMIAANHLSPAALSDAENTARLNRGLHQMLRLVSNMSDAGRANLSHGLELRSLADVFSEIMEKAQSLTEKAGVSISYEGLPEEVCSMADADLLERAVFNILSNAVKYTPPGGTIRASLSRAGRILRFSVEDSGPGISEAIIGSVFSRYRRSAGIEDGRFGLGLGMVIVRSAAAAHGGTVLIDQPQGSGARVTLTIAIRPSDGTVLRSGILRPDYMGGWDHGLVELSDCLPLEVYEKPN